MSWVIFIVLLFGLFATSECGGITKSPVDSVRVDGAIRSSINWHSGGTTKPAVAGQEYASPRWRSSLLRYSAADDAGSEVELIQLSKRHGPNPDEPKQLAQKNMNEKNETNGGNDEKTEAERDIPPEFEEKPAQKRQQMLWEVMEDGIDANVGISTFILTPQAQDCPNNSFPIKDRLSCWQARDAINAQGYKIVLLPAKSRIAGRENRKDRPGGCYLHCPTLTDCTARFNDHIGSLGSRENRRFCKDYFTRSRGRCRHKVTGKRQILARGTFSTLNDCMKECMVGPLHSKWCVGFEVTEPFNNECLFYGEEGIWGDRKMESHCYMKIASSH